MIVNLISQSLSALDSRLGAESTKSEHVVPAFEQLSGLPSLGACETAVGQCGTSQTAALEEDWVMRRSAPVSACTSMVVRAVLCSPGLVFESWFLLLAALWPCKLVMQLNCASKWYLVRL